MNGLVVLMGESFRFLAGRNIGSKESYPRQMEATRSHLNFFDYLRDKMSIQTEFIVNSYACRYLDELTDIYKPIKFNVNPTQIGLHNLFMKSCDLTDDVIDKFDFVFFLRIDLFLKERFTSVFVADKNRIMWPSICFVPHHDHWGSPRVNDTMIYVPSKWFHLVKKRNISMGHGGWHDLRPHVGHKGQGTFLNTLHDSDSNKDWNPIYRMSCRPENSRWHSAGFLFTEDAKIIREKDGSVFWRPR